MHCEEREHKKINFFETQQIQFSLLEQEQTSVKIRKRCLHITDSFLLRFHPEYAVDKIRQKCSMDFESIVKKKTQPIFIFIGTLFLEITGTIL